MKIHGNKGKKLSEAQKEKLRVYMLDQYKSGVKRGFQKGNKLWLGKTLSLETRKKISDSRLGAKNWMWKGGVTPINKKLRTGPQWKKWREEVFERDNYTCQDCGERGGELHPDHIKPFAFFPELRFELSNGRTLCRACHIKTPTWGKRTYVEI